MSAAAAMLARLSLRRIVISVVVVGCLLRLGYGVVEYRDALGKTGDEFVDFWDYDAAEHVLIARSLLEDGTYRIPAPETPTDKTIRYTSHDALFKAPLYQYFLAAVFAVSGYSFALFFPLQALIGGAAAGLTALLAWELFGRRSAALLAGLAAAGHPVLVNGASQPYNEWLFVTLLLGMIWAYVRGLRTPHWGWTLAAGVLSGLAILCRESAAPVVLALAGYTLLARPFGLRQAMVTASAIVLLAAAVVAPWSIRNYVRTGQIVPVASVTGTALSIANNECLAAEPLLSWYWAEGACPPLEAVRERIRAELPPHERDNYLITDRMDRVLGAGFVRERPLDYLKLTMQRAWSIFLPFHPRQPLNLVQQLALLVYWLAFIPAGWIGLIAALRARSRGGFLMALVMGAVLLPQIALYFSADMRYRIPADLVLACYAGAVYAGVLARLMPRAMALARATSR